jgi:hypothetical protein
MERLESPERQRKPPGHLQRDNLLLSPGGPQAKLVFTELEDREDIKIQLDAIIAAVKDRSIFCVVGERRSEELLTRNGYNASRHKVALEKVIDARFAEEDEEDRELGILSPPARASSARLTMTPAKRRSHSPSSRKKPRASDSPEVIGPRTGVTPQALHDVHAASLSRYSGLKLLAGSPFSRIIRTRLGSLTPHRDDQVHRYVPEARGRGRCGDDWRPSQQKSACL